MTVGELLSLLEGLPEETEVRLMTQASWPFEYSVHHTVLASDLQHNFIPDGLFGAQEGLTDRDGNTTDILYLVEGTQLGYGTQEAW